MKKVRLMKLALIGLLMGMTQSAHAFDWSDSSYGNNPAEVLYTNSIASDGSNTLFLYNVGAQKFVNTGGYWGTEIVCLSNDYGMPLWISATGKKQTYYSMRFDVNKSAYIDYRNNGVASVGFYADGTSANGWQITYNSSDKTFTLYNTTLKQYVLYNDAATGARANTLTSNSRATSNYAKWKLISRKDILEQFANVANVDYDTPIDATFYITNQNFSRTNHLLSPLYNNPTSGNWLKGTGTTLVNRTALCGVLSSQTYEDNVAGDGNAQICYLEGSPSSYLGGEGSGYVVKAEDVEYAYVEQGETIHYNAMYGAYYNAKISGNGSVYQSFKVEKAGWYEVSCQGFNTTGNKTACLYASVAGTDEAQSNRSNTIQGLAEGVSYNMTSAGIAFAEEKYTNVVLFYVPNDGDEVTIGIKIENAGEGEYTEFDDFRLVYRGLPEYPILLDENKENTDYIVFPEAGKTATVVLKRTFSTATTGSLLWNSIVLPFNLSGAQVKNYFGQNVKLAKLKELTASKIWYESVDLSTKGLEAGVPYIIKCDRTLAQYTKGAITVASKNDNTAVETLDADAEYIVIPQVALVKGEDGKLPLSTVTAPNGNAKIKACGLYVQQNIPLEAGHHYYAYAKGILYHYSNQLPADNPRETLPMKGFRVYFDWTETTASGAKLSCYLDGVEEQTIITAIEGVTTGEALTPANGRKGIFTLDGQQVRGTGDSVEGLHKGVYIVNGKKLVVK
ncbi:MAG: hypothetical protein MR216_11125 [Bacteroidales bacterium]|nr:hypothetical protein [Bacteroidales bacterium]